MRDDGFILAIFSMIVMAVALIYTLTAFMLGKSFSLPAWADWLIPIIIVLGIGVAGYLSYVETQNVAAVCGPIGDCNAVQTSPYATLFGFLPVGVLGFLGYVGLLAAWLARKWIPRFEKLASLAFLAMSVFAVIFSLYLTYLEPFVIHAVCIWCTWRFYSDFTHDRDYFSIVIAYTVAHYHTVAWITAYRKIKICTKSFHSLY